MSDGRRKYFPCGLCDESEGRKNQEKLISVFISFAGWGKLRKCHKNRGTVPPGIPRMFQFTAGFPMPLLNRVLVWMIIQRGDGSGETITHGALQKVRPVFRVCPLPQTWSSYCQLPPKFLLTQSLIPQTLHLTKRTIAVGQAPCSEGFKKPPLPTTSIPLGKPSSALTVFINSQLPTPI